MCCRSSATRRAGGSQPRGGAGGRHRTAPRALPPRWALALPAAALPASPGAAARRAPAFSGGEPQLRHRPQHREQDPAHGQRCPSAPRSASRGCFSGSARHRRPGGGAAVPRAAKPRETDRVDSPQTPFSQPRRALLQRDAARQLCRRHSGNKPHRFRKKKDLGHKYPTKCCGPFLSDSTSLLINCRIFLPSAEDCFMPVSEAGFCCR